MCVCAQFTHSLALSAPCGSKHSECPGLGCQTSVSLKGAGALGDDGALAGRVQSEPEIGHTQEYKCSKNVCVCPEDTEASNGLPGHTWAIWLLI